MSVGVGTGEVRRGVTIFDGKMMRYVHVEPVGTVLTFWSVIATLITATAAVLVAVFG